MAIVNSGGTTAEFEPDWPALGLSGVFRGRDLWSHADVGVLSPGYTAHVPSHGVVMLKLTRAAASS